MKLTNLLEIQGYGAGDRYEDEKKRDKKMPKLGHKNLNYFKVIEDSYKTTDDVKLLRKYIAWLIAHHE